MEDLGEEQGSESKNANLEAGVPGVTMDDYLRNTIRRETLFVKGNGQEIWGWSGGWRGKVKTPTLTNQGWGTQNQR
jgi:hypothetical protein